MKQFFPLLIVCLMLSSFNFPIYYRLRNNIENVCYTDNYYAQLGSIKDGTASVNEILLDPVLRVFHGEMVLHRPTLISFTMASSRDIHNDFIGGVNEGKLSKDQMDMIRRSRAGDIIYIEEILWECAGGYNFNLAPMASRELPPIQIKVIH